MNILRQLREAHGYRLQDLADYLGVTKQAYCNYENSKREPSVWTLKKIADFYGITLDALVVPDGERMVSAGTVRIPVVCYVPAGIPIDAIEDIVDWEEIPTTMTRGGKQYFGLIVHGDSMYPKYIDNDTVIVRKQPDFDSGDDCVVYVNGYNATLKEMIKNADGSITLRPRNPEYPPHTYTTEEVMGGLLNVAGIVVELRRKVK